MHRVMIAVGVLALSACGPVSQTRVNADACTVTANDSWRPDGGAEFSVEATASGPDCARAVATLVIRDSQGRAMWAEAHPAAHIMVLAPAQDAAAMRDALAAWISPASNTIMQTSSALPEWPGNADAPQNGEFPFYPEAGYGREAYNTLRSNNLPLYCYVQGMESQACLALSEGGLTKIGVQTFPG